MPPPRQTVLTLVDADAVLDASDGQEADELLWKAEVSKLVLFAEAGHRGVEANGAGELKSPDTANKTILAIKFAMRAALLSSACMSWFVV